MTPALRRACEDSVHVITAPGHVLRGARAVLFFLELTDGKWLARLIARSPLIWPLEWGYRIVTTHRGFFAQFLFRDE